MFIKKIFSYIIGYMRISVEGYFAERFINMCTQKNIFVWNTRKMGSSMFKCNIYINDFRKIKPIAKKTRCRVTIKSKRGLPFLFEKYKKRRILAFLLILFIGFLIAISNFVWNIDIECDGEIDKNEIMQILNSNGLEIGKLKKEIDTNKIINNLRYERKDIAWAGITYSGTNAKVKLVKAEEKPEIIDDEKYCNIVSDKEGIITKINVQNGIPAVKTGDFVTKGTILVNGWLEGKYTGIRYVHAIADIEAKVWYSKKVRIDKNQEISIQTGNTKNKYSIKFNNFEINLFKTLSKFQNYDTIVENKKIKIFSDYYLPIELKIFQVFEIEKQQVTYSVSEIKNMYIPKIEAELEEQIQDKEKITDKKVNINEQEGFVDIEIIYEVIEALGTEENIVF